MTFDYKPKDWKEEVILLRSLRWVVGGCARGGTSYFANVLRKCLPDWRIGHEEIFGRDGIKWHLLLSDRCHVDVSGRVPYHADSVVKAYIPLVHLIRHPVPSINSLAVYKPFGVVDFNTAADRWYECHRLMIDAGQKTNLYQSIRLEDMEHLFPAFCKNMCIPFSKEVLDADRGRSTPSTAYDWDDLPCNVKQIAGMFGYKKQT